MFIDDGIASDPLRRRLRRLSRAERKEEALAFVDAFHREGGLSDHLRIERRRSVTRSLDRLGRYEHTPDELAFGARVAWRNNARCIGRLFWKALDVVDCRAVVAPDDMAAQIVEHLRAAQGQGRIRSMISVFAPVAGRDTPAYVENAQVVQFAGYAQDDGGVLGDPLNLEFTRIALALGWKPKGGPGPFDVLPLIIRDRDGRRLVYDLPDAARQLVDIRHPVFTRFADLKLSWYAVPMVSDMILTIGGIDYPCAPFNGHYMGSEIASRDLTDETRYDRLEAVADVIGAAPDDPLRRDQALLELNRAVLHSYRAAGVSIVDHHTASAQYVEFVHMEQAAGRAASGEWSWIVPPQASSACPVFHLPMTDLADVPNFYRSRASDGAALTVSRVTEERSPAWRRIDRLRRRFRRWRRTLYQ